MSKDQEKKPRRKKGDYNGLTYEQFVESVARLMAEGSSNKRAAKTLGVSPGQVAGVRDREGIPSKNPAPFPPKLKLSPEEIERLGLKEARSEASRCESKKVRCPFEAEVGTPYCKLHKDEGEQAARRA